MGLVYIGMIASMVCFFYIKKTTNEIIDGSKSTSKLTTPKLTTTPKPTKKSTKVSIKTTTTVAPKSAEMPPSDPEMLCFGEYVFPPRCEDSECLYKLSWAYVPEDDNVEFSLETRMNGTGWTGK